MGKNWVQGGGLARIHSRTSAFDCTCKWVL